MRAALQTMEIGARPLGEHAATSGSDAIDRIESVAEQARGRRVLHVSVAGHGGGVPDLLGALLPLLSAVGVEVEWRVLFGDLEFQSVTAGLHDGLQGAESAIEPISFEGYLEACRKAASGLNGEASYDAVVVHDPGTLGLAPVFDAAKVVWRCHVDASRRDEPAWESARPLAERCEAVVFAEGSFAPDADTAARAHVIAPGIDPLSARNAQLPPGSAGGVIRRLGADLDRPLCSQLMRLDRWGDPHTALEAFSLVREDVPELQFVIACRLDGAGEAWSAAKEISDYAAGQEDVHVLTSYAGNLGNLELGALNQLSRLAVRLSLREGFGLAASEALWRGTPVVGGHDGGTALQVRDGVDGYIIDGADQTAERIVELVRDPGLAIEMGRSGHERVRERFLITRVLEDELRLLNSLG
jgi:trehalose synthase